MTLRDARNPNDAKPPKRKNKHNSKNKCGEERRKTKLCWFHLNHPHGCVFTIPYKIVYQTIIQEQNLIVIFFIQPPFSLFDQQQFL